MLHFLKMRTKNRVRTVSNKTCVYIVSGQINKDLSYLYISCRTLSYRLT